MAAKRNTPADATMSEREFARHIGAALSTVQARVRAGLLPRAATKNARGQWRINPDIGRVEWDANGPLHVKGDESEEGTIQAYREARARREAAQAALAEIELAERKRELVRAADVESRLVGTISACKTKLLALPARARQQDPALTKTQIAMLDDLIREALEDLAGDGEPEETDE